MKENINDKIYKFCKNATSITTTTDKSINDLNLDFNNDEIKRNRFDKDNKGFYFNLCLHTGVYTNLFQELKFMQTLELYYPNTFTWRFNGEHIEAYAYVEINKEVIGIFTRYKGMKNFIKLLRYHLERILKYRGDEDFVLLKKLDEFIIADGSVNKDTDLYCVQILPTYSLKEILNTSKNNDKEFFLIKKLNMKYWVREINPDFFKDPKKTTIQRIKLTPKIYKKYPPCIKKISLLKKKGNWARFLLSTFLLSVHGERDAKHQLDTMLSDEERDHINKGNCSEQWRVIVNRQYSSPSCKTMIESGFCDNDCGNSRPCELKEINEGETK